MFTFYCYSTLVQYSIIFLQKLVGYQMFFLLFTLHQTSLNFSNNSFFTSKDIYLFYLKLLTYPFIFGSFMHNGLFFIILVSHEKRINKHRLFNFCHMQTHQVLFYDLCIAYSYSIFVIQHFFSVPLPPNFKNCWLSLLYHAQEKKIFSIDEASGVFYSLIIACRSFFRYQKGDIF